MLILVTLALADDCAQMPKPLLESWSNEELGKLYKAKGEPAEQRIRNLYKEYVAASYRASSAADASVTEALANLGGAVQKSEYEELHGAATIAVTKRCRRSGRNYQQDWTIDAIESYDHFAIRVSPPDTNNLGGFRWLFGIETRTWKPWVPVWGEPILTPNAYAYNSDAYFDLSEYVRVQYGTLVTPELGFSVRGPVFGWLDLEMAGYLRPLAIADYAAGTEPYAFQDSCYYAYYADGEERGCLRDTRGTFWFETDMPVPFAAEFRAYIVPTRGLSLGIGVTLMDLQTVGRVMYDPVTPTSVLAYLSPSFSIGTLFR